MKLDQVYNPFRSLLLVDGSEIHHWIDTQVLKTKQEWHLAFKL